MGCKNKLADEGIQQLIYVWGFRPLVVSERGLLING